MEGRRNALLADMARDAEIERTDFLARAGQQLDRFLDAHRNRIRELGGLILIDDDPDYLAVAPDGTFRSRSRVYDETRGEWITETEIVETAAELVELYNPADVLQAFAEAQAEDIGIEGPSGVGDGDDDGEGDGAATSAADAYAGAADQWAAGQPAVAEAHDEDSAAQALYELALDFQDRSQRTEAGLIEQFENASGALLGFVPPVVIVDDDDEHLSLELGGFRGRVIPEGDTSWQDISSPDQIVRYYDPTDVFGDLAEAIADAYPAVAEDAGGERHDDADDDEDEGDDEADDHDADDDDGEDEGDDSGNGAR
jgi:hypothetical protein